MPPECLRARELPGREEASGTLGRVKAWAQWVSEFSAVVCTEAVTKQFVQTLPGECQLFGAVLVRSRTVSTEGCLLVSLPSASCELVTPAGLQRSQPAAQGRAHVSVWGCKGEALLFVVCFCCFF